MLDLVTTGEASQILNVSVQTVNRWAAEGVLQEVGRIGRNGMRVFERKAVEKHASNRTMTAAKDQ